MDNKIKESYRSEIENSGIFSDSEVAIYCDQDVFNKHKFYIQLTESLSPAFSDKISQQELLNISEISYFFLRALLAFDTIIDDGVTSNLKLGVFNYETALTKLQANYPNDDKLWNALKEIKKKYYKATELEKRFYLEERSLDLDEFVYIAEGKSIFVILIPLMLGQSSGNPNNVEKLQKSLLNFHVGLQVLDDIEDFITDIDKSQITYANSSTKKYLSNLGIDSDSLNGKMLYKYFFASGLALEHLDLAERHFTESLQEVENMPVNKFKSHIFTSGINQVNSLREEVKRLLPKATTTSTV
ncbi:hypothetical protein [Idiomarina xiamenensis]|uniref:Uncharacterized protein n=1 Tax=Idiomarina xiamenensis 10-D-4 TaxID=740709 RepID=K2L0J0_9GAMM|nr:hypothetical protein [Idiomarina xiamenensis]EKE83435.1 hypothetical protein A10D4_08437 [Idiomarina xiamenensis 10-D-4]